MGMYTEIFFRADLVKDVPTEVVEALQRMTRWNYDRDYAVLPDHELFKCPRWDMIGGGSSAYFPVTESKIEFDSHYSHQWSVLLLANFKNYNGEIGKFFNWIDEYVDAPLGSFLGYSLYEEDTSPTLYHKVSEDYWDKRDKEQIQFWKSFSETVNEPDALG